MTNTLTDGRKAMNKATRSLTLNQIDFLKSVWRTQSAGSVNWAGSDQAMRATLTERGLVTHRHGRYGHAQRHGMWSKYTLTDLGADVLMGWQFDLGLEAGFKIYCVEMAVVKAKAAVEAEAAAQGEWGTNQSSVDAVRQAFGMKGI